MNITELVQTKTLLETKQIQGDIIVTKAPFESLLEVDGLDFLVGEKTEDSAIRSCIVTDDEAVKVIITETGRGKTKTIKVFSPDQLKKEIKTVYNSVKAVADKLNLKL